MPEIETAFLQGGPMNGQRMPLQGRVDTITVELRDPADMLIQPEAKLPRIGPMPMIKTGLYRRSLVTKHIFVWQP